MPEGSSSAAPVTTPGPSRFQYPCPRSRRRPGWWRIRDRTPASLRTHRAAGRRCLALGAACSPAGRTAVDLLLVILGQGTHATGHGTTSSRRCMAKPVTGVVAGGKLLGASGQQHIELGADLG